MVKNSESSAEKAHTLFVRLKASEKEAAAWKKQADGNQLLMLELVREKEVKIDFLQDEVDQLAHQRSCLAHELDNLKLDTKKRSLAMTCEEEASDSDVSDFSVATRNTSIRHSVLMPPSPSGSRRLTAMKGKTESNDVADLWQECDARIAKLKDVNNTMEEMINSVDVTFSNLMPELVGPDLSLIVPGCEWLVGRREKNISQAVQTDAMQSFQGLEDASSEPSSPQVLNKSAHGCAGKSAHKVSTPGGRVALNNGELRIDTSKSSLRVQGKLPPDRAAKSALKMSPTERVTSSAGGASSPESLSPPTSKKKSRVMINLPH